MEGEKFDELIRSALGGVQRRGVVRAGIGTLAAAVLTSVGLGRAEESEAKKKKKHHKKKQSPPPTPPATPPSPPSPPSPPPPPPPVCKQAGEACANNCCNGLTCSINPICSDYNYCCEGVGASCSSVCACCGDDTICNTGGTCQSCGSDIACISDCCQVGSEICTVPVANANNASCQAGGCPANANFCNAANLNFCTNNCICATSVSGATVCTDLDRDENACQSCTNDAQCGAGKICIDGGPLCGACNGLTRYCVNATCPPAAASSAAKTNPSSFIASRRVPLHHAGHHAHRAHGSKSHGR